MERIGAFYKRELKTLIMQQEKDEKGNKGRVLMPHSFGNGTVGEASLRATHGGSFEPLTEHKHFIARYR